jgi:diguanylate cyclase (GGDEF)-like protein/PAS domain S-box-containing protein
MDQDASDLNLSRLLDATPFGTHIYELTNDNRLVLIKANPAANHILGIDHSQLTGKTMEEAFPALKQTSIPALYDGATAEGERSKMEIVEYQDEKISGIFEVSSFQVGKNRVAVFFRDVTEREKAIEELQEIADKYRSLVESYDDPIYLVDSNYRYLFMNKTHRSRLGIVGNEYEGQSYGLYYSVRETNEFSEEIDLVFKSGISLSHEHQSRKDNKYFLRTFSPVRDRRGTVTAVAVISKDITDYKAMEEKLQTLSITDELTGLFNRRGFYTLAEHQLKLARRQKNKIYLLYADQDNLKEINDTWGHREGDAALVDIAAILKGCFRDSDVVARVGGDEFAVVPIGAQGENIDAILVRFVRKIDDFNKKCGRNYELSLSFGLACYDPLSPVSVDELIRIADETMYEQKRNKKKP